jgi:hypothetical protein
MLIHRHVDLLLLLFSAAAGGGAASANHSLDDEDISFRTKRSFYR